MALVFGDLSAHDAALEPSITHLRCSLCKELKPCCACEPGACRHNEASGNGDSHSARLVLSISFPPSCARWRRGVCKQCRASKARIAPLLKRKLESARHRYGSVKSVTLADVERALRSCSGTDTLVDEDLAKWRIVKKNVELPFGTSNMIWVKRGGKTQVSC